MPFTPHSVLHTNSVGMMARQFEMDVTADNLANLNTPGFIASRANFQEYLFEKVPASLMNGPYRGPGVRPSTSLSYTLGPMVQSGSPTDLAIFGPGFFRVEMPDGTTGYTRNGSFQRDAEGNLVTAGGLRLIWDGKVPTEAKDIRISAEGVVEVRVGEDWESSGQISMATFENSSGMVNAGGSTYTADESSGPAIIGTPNAHGARRPGQPAPIGPAPEPGIGTGHALRHLHPALLRRSRPEQRRDGLRMDGSRGSAHPRVPRPNQPARNWQQRPPPPSA